MKAFDNYSPAESHLKSTESGSMAFVKDSDLNQKSNSVPNVKKNVFMDQSLKETGYDPKKKPVSVSKNRIQPNRITFTYFFPSVFFMLTNIKMFVHERLDQGYSDKIRTFNKLSLDPRFKESGIRIRNSAAIGFFKIIFKTHGNNSYVINMSGYVSFYMFIIILLGRII